MKTIQLMLLLFMASLNIQLAGEDLPLVESSSAIEIIKSSFFCLAIVGLYSVAKKMDQRRMARLKREREQAKAPANQTTPYSHSLESNLKESPLQLSAQTTTILQLMRYSPRTFRRGSSDSELLKSYKLR